MPEPSTTTFTVPGGTLLIRCWHCGSTLLTINGDCPELQIEANIKEIEMGCPFCGTCCGYYMNNQDILKSAHWDPDVDNVILEGRYQQMNREALRLIKSSFIDSTIKADQEILPILRDYIEYLDERDLSFQSDGNRYIEEYFEVEGYSKSRIKRMRRAFHKAYKLFET